MKIGFLLIAAFLVSLGIVLFGEAGLLSAYRISQDKAKLESRVKRLEVENERLKTEIELVQKNPQHLEHTIRKSLSLVAPDEILYEFQ